MKLFTNFNTKIRDETWSYYSSHYPPESLMLVRKGKWYVIHKIIFPLITQLVLFCGGVSLLVMGLGSQSPLFWSLLWLLVLLFVLFVFPLINFWIGYVMDFMIIAPDHIIRVDQKGLFHREHIVINTNTIKSIKIEKDGIWRSVFDYGTICIRAGGEGEEDTMIHMRFVDNPESIRIFIAQKQKKAGEPV